MQSDAEDEYQEMLLKGRAPMQAIDPRVDPQAVFEGAGIGSEGLGVSLDVDWVEDQRDFATLAGEWDALCQMTPRLLTSTAGI